MKYYYIRFSYTDRKGFPNRIRRQCGGNSLMIWGMVMSNGLIAVKAIDKRFNSVKYIDLLQYFAVKLINLNFRDCIIVQDNSPVHKSKVAMEYLSKQNFKTLEWPAKSPDLNIMENIWHLISNEVYKGNQPSNLEDLENKIFLAVETLINENRTTICDMFSTYRRRLVNVIKSKGDIL